MTGRARGIEVPVSIDPQFIRRVYRTSGWVAAVALFYLLSTRNWKIIAGFACGTLVALILLKSHEILVPRLLSASRKRNGSGGFTLALVLLKYVGLFAGLWALFAHDVVSIGAFFGGVVLVQGIIFLKVVGLIVVGQMNSAEDRPDGG